MTETQYTSEFPQYSDYTRIFYLAYQADYLGVKVNNFQVDKIREYYSVLDMLFINLSRLTCREDKPIDEALTSLNTKTFNIILDTADGVYDRNLIRETIKELNVVHKLIIDFKRQVGLGIVIRKELSPSAKLHSAFQVNTLE